MDFRGNIGAYGSPWGAYKHIYVDSPIRLGLLDPKAPAGTKYEVKVKVPATGETVDVLALIDQLFYANETEAKAIVEKLAYAHNELLPSVAIGEKAEPIKNLCAEQEGLQLPRRQRAILVPGVEFLLPHDEARQDLSHEVTRGRETQKPQMPGAVLNSRRLACPQRRNLCSGSRGLRSSFPPSFSLPRSPLSLST